MSFAVSKVMRSKGLGSAITIVLSGDATVQVSVAAYYHALRVEDAPADASATPTTDPDVRHAPPPGGP